MGNPFDHNLEVGIINTSLKSAFDFDLEICTVFISPLYESGKELATAKSNPMMSTASSPSNMLTVVIKLIRSPKSQERQNKVLMRDTKCL
jgi:hypothetical protein